MFVYCVERLHMSKAEAYLRITVARASRRHPVLLEMLADGRMHLSGIETIAKHLTDDNRDRVLARAAGLSQRKIDELAAELAPKPDVPDRIRKLPARPAEQTPAPSAQLRTYGVAKEVRSPAVPPAKSTLAALAPARYKVEFTAGVELRDKLDRLRAEVPGADLATLVEICVTEKLERIEKRRFAKTDKPRKSVADSDTTPTSRYIPAAVRREVRERDGDQCTFVSADGKRCSARGQLEFDHVHVFGKRGDHSVENLRLRCRAHNLMDAEREYGADKIRPFRSRARDRGYSPGTPTRYFAMT
jgi:hypothetical protein